MFSNIFGRPLHPQSTYDNPLFSYQTLPSYRPPDFMYVDAPASPVEVFNINDALLPRPYHPSLSGDHTPSPRTSTSLSQNPHANLSHLPGELLATLVDVCVALDKKDHAVTSSNSPMKYLHRGETACPVAWETPYVLGEDVGADDVEFLGVDKSDSVVMRRKKKWGRIKALQGVCKRLTGLCYSVLWNDVDLSHRSLEDLERFFVILNPNIAPHVRALSFCLTPKFSAYIDHINATLSPQSLRSTMIGRILRALPNLKFLNSQIRTNVHGILFDNLALYGNKLTKFVLEPNDRVQAKDLEWLFLRTRNLVHIALSKVDGPQVERRWDGRRLSVSRKGGEEESCLFRILSDLPNLQVLDLCDCQFLTDEAMTLLSKTKAPFPVLKRLLLPYNLHFSLLSLHKVLETSHLRQNLECLSAGPFTWNDYERAIIHITKRGSGKFHPSDFNLTFTNLHSLRMIEDNAFLYFSTVLPDRMREKIENICLFRPTQNLNPEVVREKFSNVKRVWSCGQWGWEKGKMWVRGETDQILYKVYNGEEHCQHHHEGQRDGHNQGPMVVMVNDFWNI